MRFRALPGGAAQSRAKALTVIIVECAIRLNREAGDCDCASRASKDNMDWLRHHFHALEGFCFARLLRDRVAHHYGIALVGLLCWCVVGMGITVLHRLPSCGCLENTASNLGDRRKESAQLRRREKVILYGDQHVGGRNRGRGQG